MLYPLSYGRMMGRTNQFIKGFRPLAVTSLPRGGWAVAARWARPLSFQVDRPRHGDRRRRPLRQERHEAFQGSLQPRPEMIPGDGGRRQLARVR